MKNKLNKREFFREGDLVVDKNNNELIFIKAQGFDEAVVIDINGNTITLSCPLYFHSEFDPGYIVEKYS